MTDYTDYNQHRLSEVVAKVLRMYGLDDKLESLRIAQVWEQLMGKAVAGLSGKTELRKGILHIQITSASLRKNLMMQRTTLVLKLNAALGKELIKEIRFH